MATIYNINNINNKEIPEYINNNKEIPEYKKSWYCNRCDNINYARKSIYPHCGNGCGNSKKLEIIRNISFKFICVYCHTNNHINILSKNDIIKCKMCCKIPSYI